MDIGNSIEYLLSRMLVICIWYSLSRTYIFDNELLSALERGIWTILALLSMGFGMLLTDSLIIKYKANRFVKLKENQLSGKISSQNDLGNIRLIIICDNCGLSFKAELLHTDIICPNCIKLFRLEEDPIVMITSLTFAISIIICIAVMASHGISAQVKAMSILGANIVIFLIAQSIKTLMLISAIKKKNQML
jgi:hypothetical protein